GDIRDDVAEEDRIRANAQVMLDLAEDDLLPTPAMLHDPLEPRVIRHEELARYPPELVDESLVCHSSPTLFSCSVTERQRVSSGRHHGGDRRNARPAVEGRDRSRRGHGLDTPSRPRFLAVEPGLYVTFFTEGEAFDRELPPVGPLEHVVVRDRILVADRKDGETNPFALGGRWIEAERELRRATGEEPGGTTRPDLRIGAPEGVYLRFVSFGEAA